MILRPPRSTLDRSSAASDVYKRQVQQALRAGATVEEVHEATGIDPWFLDQIALVNEVAELVRTADRLRPDLLALAKRHGFSDRPVSYTHLTLPTSDLVEISGVAVSLKKKKEEGRTSAGRNRAAEQ